jgi:hypothetical protein
LFDTLHNANRHYWGAIVKPGGHLTARPPHYSRGDFS